MADRKFPPGMLADYYQDLLPKEAELAGADLDRVEQALEAEFEQALIDCGISKKGAGFARVAWHAIGDIFAALPLNEEPFGAADMVYRLLRHKASLVRQKRRDLAYLRELSQVRKKAQKARKRVAKGGSR